MDDLAKRAYCKLARFQITLGVLIFVPAWSLTYCQGWLVWSLFLICCVAITGYFLRHDRALIVRRMQSGPLAEREPRQKLIQTFSSVLVCSIFVVSSLDYLLGWSTVPVAAVLSGADRDRVSC